MTDLDKLRDIIDELDDQRYDAETEEERKLAEVSCAAMRAAERTELVRIQAGIIDSVKGMTTDLKDYAREIRERVEKMNRPSKVADIAGEVIEILASVIEGISVWSK